MSRERRWKKKRKERKRKGKTVPNNYYQPTLNNRQNVSQRIHIVTVID